MSRMLNVRGPCRVSAHYFLSLAALDSPSHCAVCKFFSFYMKTRVLFVKEILLLVLLALVLFSGLDEPSIFFFFFEEVTEPQNHSHCLMSTFCLAL